MRYKVIDLVNKEIFDWSYNNTMMTHDFEIMLKALSKKIRKGYVEFK